MFATRGTQTLVITAEWDEKEIIRNMFVQSNLFHGLSLSGRTHPADRQTHIDGRSDTLVKQFSFQEDLTISDGNHVCGNVS